MSGSDALMLQAAEIFSAIGDKAELEARPKGIPSLDTDKGDGMRHSSTTSTLPSPNGHSPLTRHISMPLEITRPSPNEPTSPNCPSKDLLSILIDDAQKEAIGITAQEVEIGPTEPENSPNQNGAPIITQQEPDRNPTTTRGWRRMRRPLLTGTRWSYFVTALITIALLAVIIALSVKISKPSEDHGTPTISDPAIGTQDFSLSDAPPVVDSPVDTKDVIFGTYFGSASNRPQQKLVYYSSGAGGMICVRTKLEGPWLPSVRCILNANPKNNTPLTLLDWAGGPTVYYLTANNKLSGLDYVPANDTWVLSSLAKRNITVHPQSQISSVTWLNGSSTWVYYQDPITSQVREIGMNDYRNLDFWREGSSGPLGLAINGSFISATRYWIGTDEFEEVYFEADSNIVHGKRYAYGVWGSDQYAINGTTSGFAAGAAFCVTNIVNPSAANTNTILVAYMTTDGFVTTQTRGTVNITDFGAFSKPVKVVQNDGDAGAGLAVDGSSGTPKLVAMNKQSILEYIGDVAAVNWTTAINIST